MTTELDADQVIRDATAALRKKFPDRPESEIEAVVREELSGLADRPVQDYLSVLTERAAKKRLEHETTPAQPGGEG